MISLRKLISIIVVSAVCASSAFAAPDALSQKFASPPMSAKPWTFWWFEGGYANKAGMVKDIAEMRKMGIGGVMHMQTIDTTGLPLPSQPPMLGDEWADWFGEAARLAGNAGITFSASIVDGWAFGGKWVDKESAAMQLVNSELQIDDQAELADPLPMPFSRLGVYHDIAIIAFPEKPDRAPTPLEVSASNTVLGYCAEENWPAIHACDADPNTYWRTSAAPSPQSPIWIQCTYSKAFAASGLYIKAMSDGGIKEADLQASNDGINFQTVAHINADIAASTRIPFPTVTAKVFRLVITSAYAPDIRLAEFQILRGEDQPSVRSGIKWWNYKSGNRGILFEGAMDDNNPFTKQYDLKSTQVIDLTQYLQPDGRLNWVKPQGKWTIMRFGWTTIGQPARMSAGGGYEVDVLSRKGADLMFDNAAVGMLKATAKTAPGVMKAFHTDSWEIGADVQGQQPTWTPDFRAQFQKKRGYDLLRFLPAMARRLVDDSETTERFLTDYRATIADLIADYYEQLQKRAHQHNALMNPESGYGSYPFPHLDGLKVFGRADLPMAEVSHNNSTDDLSSMMTNPFCDVLRTAASGARIYGRQLVQAETLTYHPWLGQITAPDRYRKTLNYCFADGLNNTVIHKYVHQPFEYKPGLEDYGIFSRHYTWWPMADGMFSYIARCQYLLQQGKFVADAAYFVGEGSSRYVPSKGGLNPALPLGYDFDGMNTEVLLNRLSAKNGKWSLPDGLSYRYLVLTYPYSTTMSTAVLQKIALLVKSGCTLVGQPPVRTPGLYNRTSEDAKLKKLAIELWGSPNGKTGIRKVGKGRVVCGITMERLMSSDGLPADLSASVVTVGKTAKQRAGLSGANWIWHGTSGGYPAPGVRYFRSSITIPAGRKITRALVSMSADNEFVLSVNGKRCISSTSWEKASDADVTKAFKPGQNIIEVMATNTTTEPTPAGVIGKFVVTLEKSQPITLITNSDEWKSSADKASWSPATTVGALGCAPWGRFDDSASTNLDWIHRRSASTDIYFMANPTKNTLNMNVTLRAAGKLPELFDPLTGKTRALTTYTQHDGVTSIPMTFEAYQGLFIVFKQAAKKPSSSTAPNFAVYSPSQTLTGAWTVQFDPAWVSPAIASADKKTGKIVFDKLVDWTQRSEPGIKYYSGIAKYIKSFTIPNSLTPAMRAKLRLSLGVVKDIARVYVNGKDAGVVWCEPWQIDIGAYVKPGQNTVEIDAANLWANRVIRDASLPEDQRLTLSNFRLDAGTALYPSGLMGPVQIMTTK